MKANRQGAVSFFISVQMMSDNGQYFYSELDRKPLYTGLSRLAQALS